MATTNPAAGTLLELDARKRVTLGKLAQHDRYTARVMSNGSILLEPAIVITAAEAAVLADPEFIAMIRQRVAETKAGNVVPVDWELLAMHDDVEDPEND